MIRYKTVLLTTVLMSLSCFQTQCIKWSNYNTVSRISLIQESRATRSSKPNNIMASIIESMINMFKQCSAHKWVHTQTIVLSVCGLCKYLNATRVSWRCRLTFDLSANTPASRFFLTAVLS